MLGVVLIGSILLVVIVGLLFINLSPVFGGKPDAGQKVKYAASSQYTEGKFVNQIETKMNMGFTDYIGLIGDYIKGTPNAQPSAELPIQAVDSAKIADRAEHITQITWLGHSALLLEMEGKNILLDPMLSDTPSPHPLLGSKRFSPLPITLESLPHIDMVLISHDHYDHLDYESVQKLKDKVDHFYTPLGVGNHLKTWGVAEEKIHELDWWDEVQLADLKLVCTPARHFSGRGIFDRDNTLWASWIIQSARENIYFSGDSGYGPHFKEIGEKYGPFDFAMVECGQYDPRWEAIHMMPEQSVQAALDVKASLMMPIHWGSFVLSLHSWDDPIKRVSAEAKRLNQPITTPQLGEAIQLPTQNYPDSYWWKLISKN